MTLTSGTRFGEYEIVGSLGTGGMGEVYRAHDVRLHRDVALKVLPDLVAADPDRLARFEREAQLLASLNHPNIASIHGVEEHAGLTALVLELVEGPTLADLLNRGPLAIAVALDVARQLATALEFAHERGIVHRDVKPANIKMTNDGHVKVLDFGLAKALDNRRSPPYDAASTTIGLATKAGVILGTAPYMSPEQAKGQPVDRRTDVWSFGCVLYEMLVGRRAFESDSLSELLAAILTHDVDFSRLPADTPSGVRELLRRCLDRDPKQRLRDMGEARIVFERPLQQEPAAARIRSVPPATWLVACVAGGLLIGALAMAVRTRNRDAAFGAPVHLLMSLAPAERLAGDAYKRPVLQGFAIAPRGRFVVFAGSTGDRTMIYRRALADTNASPVAGSDGGRFPFLSPDERWVGFFSHNSLLKVPIEGGTAITLCSIPPKDAPRAFAGASWGEDGMIAFGLERGPLWQVRDSGGSPQHLTDLDPRKHEASHRLPHHLPKGRGLLFTATSGALELGRIVVLPPASREPRTLVENAADARYAGGRLLYVRNATLFAAPFDLDRLTVTGAETPLLERVMQSIGDDNPAIDTGAAQFDDSDSGTLVYAEGGTVPPQMNRLLWIDRKGRTASIGEPGPNLLGARLSRDGKRIAVALINNDREPIRVYDLERGGFTSLPGVQGEAVFPVWTPDGRHVIFGWNRNGGMNAYAVPLDGSAAPTQVTSGANTDLPGASHRTVDGWPA